MAMPIELVVIDGGGGGGSLNSVLTKSVSKGNQGVTYVNG